MNEVGDPDVHSDTKLDRAIWPKGIGMLQSGSLSICLENVMRLRSHQSLCFDNLCSYYTSNKKTYRQKNRQKRRVVVVHTWEVEAGISLISRPF